MYLEAAGGALLADTETEEDRMRDVLRAARTKLGLAVAGAALLAAGVGIGSQVISHPATGTVSVNSAIPSDTASDSAAATSTGATPTVAAPTSDAPGSSSDVPAPAPVVSSSEAPVAAPSPVTVDPVTTPDPAPAPDPTPSVDPTPSPDPGPGLLLPPPSAPKLPGEPGYVPPPPAPSS